MNVSLPDHSDHLRRLEAELEQALVSSEDAQQQVARLIEENATVQAQLRAVEASRTAAEARIRELENRLAEKDLVPASGMSQTEEELRVAIEELRVMAEELERANEVLYANRAAAD